MPHEGPDNMYDKLAFQAWTGKKMWTYVEIHSIVSRHTLLSNNKSVVIFQTDTIYLFYVLYIGT